MVKVCRQKADKKHEWVKTNYSVVVLIKQRLPWLIKMLVWFGLYWLLVNVTEKQPDSGVNEMNHIRESIKVLGFALLVVYVKSIHY